MPSAPKTNAPARSVQDIHQRLAQPRVRAHINGASEPGLSLNDTPNQTSAEKLKELQENMQQSRMEQMMIRSAEAEAELTNSEMEARKLEVEVKTLENRSRLQELRDAMANSGKTPDAMTLAMFELLDRFIPEKGAKTDNPNDVMFSAIAGELKEMRGMILSERGKPKDDDAVSELEKSMRTMLSLREMFASLSPEVKASPIASEAARDLETTLRMQEMELSHQTRMMELRQREEQWKSDQEMRQRQLDVEERRMTMMSDSLKSIAQQFAPVIQELAAGAMNRGSVAVASPVPASVVPAVAYNPRPVSEMPRPANMQAMPMMQPDNYMPMPMPMNGNGHSIMHQGECDSCGHTVEYKDGETSVECPTCGAEFGIDYSQG